MPTVGAGVPRVRAGRGSAHPSPHPHHSCSYCCCCCCYCCCCCCCCGNVLLAGVCAQPPPAALLAAHNPTPPAHCAQTMQGWVYSTQGLGPCTTDQPRARCGARGGRHPHPRAHTPPPEGGTTRAAGESCACVYVCVCVGLCCVCCVCAHTSTQEVRRHTQARANVGWGGALARVEGQHHATPRRAPS